MEDNEAAVGVLLSNRPYLYRYLWRAFAAEPDEVLVASACDDLAAEACALLDDSSGTAAALQRALADAAASTDLEVLRATYTRLFIGPAKLPAPPWESVYATGEPLLFQESTLAVRNAYRSAGYAAAGYPHEADDHVAIELDFMATLASDACTAHAVGDGARLRELLRIQQGFLREHLLTWIGSFAERLVAAEDAGGFYPAFARLAALVCARDADVLEELLTAE